MPERFGEFLAASFAALERELPAVHHRLRVQLAPRAIGIAVGDEQVGVRFEPTRIAVGPPPVGPAIAVETTRATILAMIDAELTLADAVLGDRLLLRGRTDDLLAFHDGLQTYIHGAVRAPSFPALLRSYREARP